jgi:carboxyl-terminal processing protease
VQSVLPLPGNTALKLTTARYYTPSGRSIHRDRRLEQEHAAMMAAARDGDEMDGEAAIAEGDTGGDAASDEGTQDETDAHPHYLTASGRVVEGGGGISPDLTLDERTFPRIAARLEREGLFLRYAVEHAAAGEVPRDPVVTDQMVDEVRAAADLAGVEYTEEEWQEAVEYVRIAIGREIVRHAYDSESAARVSIKADPQVQTLAELLHRSHDLEELFELAAVMETERETRVAAAVQDGPLDGQE